MTLSGATPKDIAESLSFRVPAWPDWSRTDRWSVLQPILSREARRVPEVGIEPTRGVTPTGF